MAAEWENLVATVTLVGYSDCDVLTSSLYADGRPWVCTVSHAAPRAHVIVATIRLDRNQVPGDNWSQLVERVLDAIRDTEQGGRVTFAREHVIDHTAEGDEP